MAEITVSTYAENIIEDITSTDSGQQDLRNQHALALSVQNDIVLSTQNLIAVGSSATSADQIISDLGANYTSQDALIPQTIKISSNSVSDAPEGTGARTVLLTGYDEDYNIQSEIITLNGQTPVDTTKEYILVNQLSVITAGTGNTNAGIIYAGIGEVTSGVPATKYLCILANNGKSRAGFYLVPAGYTMFIDRSSADNRTSTNKCTIKAWTKEFGSIYHPELIRDIPGDGYKIMDNKFVLPEKTLLKLTGNNGTSTSSMSIIVDYRLIKN